MKNETFSEQLSICFKRHVWHLGRQMSHLSVQTKLNTVSSNLQYYVKIKYNL
jgi:hypothetical protein